MFEKIEEELNSPENSNSQLKEKEKEKQKAKDIFNQISSEDEYLVIASMTNIFHLLDTINNKEKEIEEKAKVKEKKEKKEKEERTKNEKHQSEKDKSTKNIPQSTLIEMKQYDLFPSDQIDDERLNNPTDRIPIIEAESKEIPLTNYQEVIKSNKKQSNKKAIKPLKYFILLRVFIFFFLTFNSCHFWILQYMTSLPKNRYYCFNVFAKEFKPCNYNDFCPSRGHTDIIYTDFSNKIDTIEEANDINNKYLPFYIKDSALFSLLNKKYLKTDSISSRYSIVIILTKREKFIYLNTFNSICQPVNIDLIITLFIAMTIGNIVFGLLADIIGRKKVLIIMVAIQAIGCTVVFSETFFILSRGVSNGAKEYQRNEQMFNFTYSDTVYPFINDFIDNSNRSEFDKAKLNDIYKRQFSEIKSEVLQGLFIQKSFKKHKLFFFIGIFLIAFCNSPIYTISIAYFMENAVTEDFFYNNNIILHSTKPVSIYLAFLLVTQLDSFHIPILIITCCMIVMLVLYIVFFYESQRFNIEYCYYVDITKFVEAIFGKKALKTEYIEKDIVKESKKDKEPYLHSKSNNKDNRQQKEDEKKQTAITLLYHRSSPTIETEYQFYLENKHCSIWDSIAMKYTTNTDVILAKKSFMKKQTKKENELKREKILSSPLKTLIQFMKSEKQIKNHNLITIAFISIVGIVSHLCYWKINSVLFYSRTNLINNDIFLTHALLFCVISIFVILGYNWIMKFLGPNTILIASFVIISLFSIIFEAIGLSDRERTDLNKTLYGSYEVIVDKYRNGLLCCLYFCLIGSTGLIIGMYFFITKLTKTIYRCTFYGYCQILVDITYVLSIGLEKNIEKTFFYVCLFSIIGLINTFFISTNADAVIIKDYRTITYDEMKEKKNN